MLRRFAYLIAVTLLVFGLCSTPGWPQVYSLSHVSPGLYAPQASHNPVNFGGQPESSPLILSVEIGTGGRMDEVIVDLRQLSGARYYDPGSDTRKEAGHATPMYRVYQIEGNAAYLHQTDTEYEDYQYRTAITHQVIEGTAIRSDKWQVELPNTGYRLGSYDLRITAINKQRQISTISLPIQIGYDWRSPRISSHIHYPAGHSAAYPGDRISVEATVSDDLCGVHAVAFADKAATETVFGKNTELSLERTGNPNTWTTVIALPDTCLPGHYRLALVAIDRAGNKTRQELAIEVIRPLTRSDSAFTLDLHQGWNLISTPKVLKQPAIGDVFDASSVEQVLTVIGGEYSEPETVKPGRGYLVKATEATTASMPFADYDPSTMPRMIDLQPGWNLIGYASATLAPSVPLTYYLGNDLKGKWTVVYTADGAQARSKSTSPYVWATNNFPTNTGLPSFQDRDNLPIVEFGQGYWIYITEQGTLIP